MKIVYLVRHAESIENKKDVLIGDLQGKLTGLGKKQAEELAENIKSLNFDVILCSKLKRARETAEIINKHMDRKIIYLKDLKERNIGNWAGLKRSEFERRWDEKSKLQCMFKPGKTGESYLDMLARAKRVIKYITRLPHKKILIISHGRFNKVLLNYLLGRPLCDKIEQGNCRVNVIKICKGKIRPLLTNHMLVKTGG